MESTTARHPAHVDVGDHPAHPLQEEAALVERLAAQDFAGPESEALVKALSLAATGVLEGWFISGDISARVRTVSRHSFELSHQELERLRRNRAELAALVDRIVRSAATLFILRGLRAREWDPEQGASLQTWFIGGALLKAKDEVRQWRRRCTNDAAAEQRYARDLKAPVPDHADLAAGEADLDAVFRKLDLDEHGRRIAELYSEGYSIRATAGLLGLTAYTVRKTVNRLRKYYHDTEGGSHV